jgi:hypothetical protein
MKLQQASRKRTKIRMLLQGTSGSGKTMSALRIAQGLSDGDWQKIAIIATENQSANLYSNLGDYNVVHLKAPFTPESYLEAIEICEQAGMEVIILDSISHSWEYLLDYHSSPPGNSFTNWYKVNLRKN